MATGGFNVIRQQTDTNKEEIYNELYLTLKNQMKVMLINDGSGLRIFPKVSVTLDIHIGNFSDLDNFPGLAHLCQRMLISGNNTHSEFNRFQELVNNCHGKISLTTSSDHTTYYFHIHTGNDSVLEQILQRFAQIFLSIPSFNEAWIEEEIEMMDSELKTEFQHNWFKYFERSTVNSDHPYSNYGLGKKKILAKMSMKQIKSKLLKFFMSYYSANIMTLCIVSGFTLDKIEKMIENIFSKIKNLKVKIPEYSEDPFKDQLCTVWYIAPKSNVKNLRLSFLLPSEEEDCWHMAVNCISFFLECNNKNSLLDTLKDKNWCNNISTSAYQEARKLNFCHVLFTLLPEGCMHIDDIILLFFEYLKLFKIKYLKSENNRLQLHKVLNNMLRYGKLERKEQAFTQQWIIKIAQRLHEYPIKDILPNRYFKRSFSYIVSMINIILDNYISPHNIRVYVINSDFTSHLQLVRNWDNADYTEHYKIPISVAYLWANPLLLLRLRIPDLELVLDPNTALYSDKFPEVIKDTLFIQLWYAYATPKSSAIQQQTKVFFHFISPNVYENPLNITLNFIFAKLVKNAIKMSNLPKDKLQWQIKNTNYGILLELASYVPVTYHGYLSSVIFKIMTLEVLHEKFETLRNNNVKILKSFASIKPSEQAFCYLQNLLSENSWSHDEVLKASASTDVTIDKMQEFIQKFVSNLYVKCFIYGEINESEALEIGDILEFNLKYANQGSTITQTRLLRHREIKLESDTHVLYEVENKLHDVSCTLAYYQIGKKTMDLNSKLALVCYIMTNRSSKYFKNIQHIRNIYMHVRVAKGIQGLQIIIEAFMNPYVIGYHIEQFISYTMKYIRRLSTEKFEKYKTDLIRHYEKIKLNNISDALWVQVLSKLYCCDQQEIEIKFIQDIEQESLFTFYKEKIYKKSATLSVHVSSKRENKLQKKDALQSEEKDQSELLDKSNASNKPEPNKVIKDFYHLLEIRYKKINDIMLFKQNYYD